jgi:Ser/Thr protein kinase RdoA (MazF antagonist)
MKNRIVIQRTIERYVREILREKLGRPESRFSLEATELGIHSHVFFLHIEGAPPLVVKGITKRQRFRAQVAATGHLLENGISVPRILHSHEDRSIFSWRQLHVLCEERITGTTVFASEAPDSRVPELAGLFSRLHAVRRDSWGKLSEPRSGGLHEYLTARTRGQLKQWGALDASFSKQLAERCAAWLRERKALVDTVTSFSLSHGDPNPGNIMVREDGTLYLLDVGHLRYLPRAIEYYMLVVHFCRDSRELLRLFDDRYFAGMAAAEREEFSASQQFFKLCVLIDFGQNLARRLAATEPGHPWHREFTDNRNRIRQAIEEILRT